MNGMSAKAPRIVILGGGYAALAAVSVFAKHAPHSLLTVIAPRKAHIKITQLHETLRYSLRRLCVPYAELGKRFGFNFIQAKLKFDTDSLMRWQHDGILRFDKQAIPFDYLLVTTGATHIAPEKTARVLGVSEFCLNQGQTLLRELCARKNGGINLSVVGGGATGIQFLFELSHYLQHNAARPWKLRLVNYEAEILGQFPERFRLYAYDKMARAGIEYVPDSAFIRQQDDTIVLAHRPSGTEFRLPSYLSLLFLGVRPNPFRIEANAFGQAIVNGASLDRVFTAGDCTRFAGTGANTLSAQVAVKKGGTVAANILALGRSAPMQAYDYVEQGYVVSLGPRDGIGWWQSPENIITGLPAAIIKASAEKQYDLLLGGLK